MKFISSMTLFEAAAAGGNAQPYVTALERFAAGRRDEATLARL